MSERNKGTERERRDGELLDRCHEEPDEWKSIHSTHLPGSQHSDVLQAHFEAAVIYFYSPRSRMENNPTDVYLVLFLNTLRLTHKVVDI
jgi:hypothetical protein